MARKRKGAPKGFKFSSPGKQRARSTAASTKRFKRISRRSSGGVTKSKTPGFKG